MEPKPLLQNFSGKRKFIPTMLISKELPSLAFSSLSSCTSGSSDPPSPVMHDAICTYRSLLRTKQPQISVNQDTSKGLYNFINRQQPKENLINESVPLLSPTMMEASTTAVAAASDSYAADSFLRLRLGSLTSKSEYPASVSSMLCENEQVSFAHTSLTIQGSNEDTAKNGVERHMFLTKYAHIKRPRNAWIHVSFPE
jgi:hypothetical protein